MPIATLKSISMFGSLSETELQSLVGLLREVPFEKDHIVIRQGQPHSSLFLVADGMLHVQRQVEQRQVFLGRLEKGGFFGEIGLFDPGTATATVRGLNKGKLLEIRGEDFDRFLDKNPAAGCRILKAMMAEMSKRLRRVNQRLSDSLFWGEGLQK